MPGVFLGKKTCEWCQEYEATRRGEVAEDAVQRVMPVPWARGASGRPVTQAIFGINVAVFVGMALAGVSVTEPSTADLVHWGANSAQLTLTGDWWRLLTNVFLHIGVIHIALNMWCLWSLGTLAESLYGSWTYAAVYLISGISGSLASIWWHPFGVSAGASGAIFGIAGALVASIKFGEFSLPPSIISSQLGSLVSFVAYNLILGAMSGRTDNGAHLGGLGAGFVMGALIALGAPGRSAWAGRIALLGCVLGLSVGAAAWLQHAQGGKALARRAYQLAGQQGPESVAELKKLADKNPNSASVRVALATAYENAGQYSQAEAELNHVLQSDPNDSWVNYRLGIVYLDEKRIGAAKKLFSDTIARNTSDSSAHYGLGLTLAEQGDHEAAIREFRTVTELDSDSAGAFYEMGSSYLKLKKYDEAIAAFSQGQKQSGDDSYFESGLAQAYQAKGMKTEAGEAQRKAAQLKTQENDD